MIRRILAVLLSLSCIIGCFSFTMDDAWIIRADDYDFPNNEDYYNKLCTTYGLSDSDKAACRAFQTYNQNKLEQVNAKIKEIDAKINSLKNDISAAEAALREIQDKINIVEGQIKTINDSIVQIEANIVEIEQQIADRERRIEELNNQIKERMKAIQPLVSTSQYIRFIMGANSFVDLIRRITSINKFTDYDKSKIEELNHERELLELDRVELVNQKADLETQQKNLESYKKSLQDLESRQKTVITNLRIAKEEQDRLRAEQEKVSANLENIIDDIDMRLYDFTPSTGWSFPVKGYFRITSAFPYYERTWGGFHNAIDIGGQSVGSNIYASANGIVVNTYSGCGYNSGLNCGNMHGNYVEYIVVIGETAYLVISQHLSRVDVSIGDTLKGGRTVIGGLGNTGYSFGAHLHQVIIRMGTMNIKEAVRSFDSVGMYFYGVSYSTAGVCSYKGYAPCYESPEEIYGVWYPNAYYN